MVAYLDAGSERVTTAAVGRVEESRLGYIFAHDDKAYGRWRTRQRHASATWGRDGGGLTGAALEKRIMGLKLTNPGLVAMPGEKVRRMRKADRAAV